MIILRNLDKNRRVHKRNSCTIFRQPTKGYVKDLSRRHKVLFKLKTTSFEMQNTVTKRMQLDAANCIPDLKGTKLTTLLSMSDDAHDVAQFVSMYMYERNMYRDGVIIVLQEGANEVIKNSD